MVMSVSGTCKVVELVQTNHSSTILIYQWNSDSRFRNNFTPQVRREVRETEMKSHFCNQFNAPRIWSKDVRQLPSNYK